MGSFVPQVITEDRASTAQIIDGGLKFDSNNSNNLTRTPGSAGNRRIWTFSSWIKLDSLTQGERNILFGPAGGTNHGVTIYQSSGLRFAHGWDPVGTDYIRMTSALFRDPSAWYHVVWWCDTTQSGTRWKIYVNGVEQTLETPANNNGEPSQNTDLGINTTNAHYLGGNSTFGHFSGKLSNVYFIDGQALGPENFGFTDPLTNTWRPKKVNTRNLDVAQGQYAIKSSEQSSDGQNAVNAFNGNINNEFAARWRNNGSEDGNLVGNTFLGQDFGVGNEKEITKFRILQGRSSGTGEMVSGVKMQWSDNNSNWTDAGTFTLDTSTFAYQEFAVNPVGKHRYWRLLCNASSNSAWLITELEMLSSDVFDKDVFGQNGFYLPFDGNSLIGEDKSGNGNDWTAIGFGGSNSIDKATGAKPILKTVGGGKVASGGIRSLHKTYAVTVQNDSGNKYFFDGVNNTGTTIPLYRGGVYTFDQSDSSNSGHPLRFATAADAAGSTEYTDGVTQSGTPGSANAYTKICVPHNAPDTLYYYCTNHNGMGGATANTTDENVADPYAWKLVLAIPLDGRVNDIHADIKGSGTNKTVTNNGVTFGSDLANFYGVSAVNDYTQYLTLPDDSDLRLGSTFTLEYWASPDPNNTGNIGVIYGKGVNDSDGFFVANTREQVFERNNTSTDINFATPLVGWHHFAWVFSSTGPSRRLYIDGVLRYSDSETINITDNGLTYVVNEVAVAGTSNRFSGKSQDFRVYKGVEKYTSNFIPASPNPDIMLDTPSGVAYPSITDKPNMGSVSFDSSNDQLLVPSSTDFAFGTSDFTVEAYVYSNASDHTSGNHYIFDTGSGNTLSLQYYQDTFNYYNSTIGGNGQNAGAFSKNSWHHVAVTRKSGTTHMFIDGVLKNSFADSHDYGAFAAKSVSIGNYMTRGYGWNGYISNLRVLKGTALYTSSFFTPPRDALTNITNTSLICCQSSESATAAEVTPGAITIPDTAPIASRFNPIDDNIETVFGEPDGYCTLNPLFNSYTGSATLTDGSLHYKGQYNANSSGAYGLAQGTIGISTGKWYWEWTMGENTPNIGLGVMRAGISTSAWPGLTNETSFVSGVDGGIGLYMPGAANYVYYWDGTTQANVSYTFPGTAVGDTVSIALDLDTPNNGKIYFAKNGVWGAGGNPETGTNPVGLSLSGTLIPACSLGGSGISSATVNFGQRPFRFPQPKGFKTISKANVRVVNPAALEPDKYFNTVLYSGDATTGRSITGVGFKPDLIWIKKRNGTSDHRLFDSVRGATNALKSNDPPGTEYTNNAVISFNNDGWTASAFNASGSTYVGWCWKAGGNSNTFNVDGTGYATASAAGITDGSIALTGASVNTTAGFSIVGYEGTGGSGTATFSHGLNKTPSFVIIKNRDGSSNWGINHSGLKNNNHYLLLTSANGEADYGSLFIDRGSSLITIDRGSSILNTSSNSYIAYCWHSVEGVSKFGVYQGNGNADGVFVYCGFKPALIMIKATSRSGSWFIMDSTRDVDNPVGKYIYGNSNDQEDASTAYIDILSNGFKQRNTGNSLNANTESYIFAAWAEAPISNLYGAQPNPR